MLAIEANALGDFLRVRRQQVRPEDVGLVAATKIRRRRWWRRSRAGSGLTSRRRNPYTGWRVRAPVVGLIPLWRRLRTGWIK